MTACAFETVGVTPSKVKGIAVKSNAVPMRNFLSVRRCSSQRCLSALMVSRPRSQRPMPSSADRLRPVRLLACIAARCAAPMASVPISAITPLLVQLPLVRSLPEPVGAAAGVGAEVGVGVVAGEVGAAATAVSMPPLVQPPELALLAQPPWLGRRFATRPLTIRQAGTNFARGLALFSGLAPPTSDWNLMNWSS